MNSRSKTTKPKRGALASLIAPRWSDTRGWHTSVWHLRTKEPITRLPDEAELGLALLELTQEPVRVKLGVVDDHHLAMTIAFRGPRFDSQRARQLALSAIAIVHQRVRITEIQGLPTDQWPTLPAPSIRWKRGQEDERVGTKRVRLQPTVFEAAIDEPGPHCRRWNWIVKTSRPVATAAFGTLLRSIRRKFEMNMAELARQNGMAGPPISGDMRMKRLDASHLLLDVEWPASGSDPGEMWAYGNVGLLNAVDSTVRIEDIQGIPRRYWFFMEALDAKN